MDNFSTSSPILWIIISTLTSLSSIVIGIITWIKSAKMMPKEITKAELENEKIELENRQRELTLVDSYELMANKSAEKAVELQKKLQKHEKDIELLKDTIKDLLAYKKEQEETIKQQNLRIDKQEKQIKSLTKELSMTQTYNYALIQQMKKENITPISPSSIDISEYKNGINGK